MILVRNLHLHIEETDHRIFLQLRLRKKLGLGWMFLYLQDRQGILDARQKNNIHFIYQILCTVEMRPGSGSPWTKTVNTWKRHCRGRLWNFGNDLAGGRWLWATRHLLC